MAHEGIPGTEDKTHWGRRIIIGVVALTVVEIGPRGGQDIAAILSNDGHSNAPSKSLAYDQLDIINPASPPPALPEGKAVLDEEPIITVTPSPSPIKVIKSASPSPSPSAIPSPVEVIKSASPSPSQETNKLPNVNPSCAPASPNANSQSPSPSPSPTRTPESQTGENLICPSPSSN